MITEIKRKHQFTKSSLKIKFSDFKKTSFFSIKRLFNVKKERENFNPIISGWNNNLKLKTLRIESEYLKTKGLSYVQITTIK